MDDTVKRMRSLAAAVPAEGGGVPYQPIFPSTLLSWADEIEELRRQLGGGCDANGGGDHTVMTQGKYRFCVDCGETLKARVTRYIHSKEPKDE